MADHVLSDDDVSILREIVREYRSGRQNKPLRSNVVEEDPTAPEMYVFLPSADIDPIASSNPDGVTATIYKLVDGELVSTGRTKTLHNITIETVLSGDYCLGHRDKFGDWYASPCVCPECP